MFRMYDLIQKKRDGNVLSEEEIKWMIGEYVKGEIPDYQMAAMMMAIYFQGMNDKEISELTLAMMHSGDVVDLSKIEGIKVDKHSTGGVGDKTTLIVMPIVAACGMKVAKMSGRGLGHTGGTLDKLESIPGFNVSLAGQEFIDCVNEHGIAVIGQTGNLVPADKLMYALRDVTATIDCIPLIASSIMSKKLAAGSDVILLDVKTGSGAFMKTVEDSKKLAEEMTGIGKRAGKKIGALITDMDQPLGNAIGNQLEVQEAMATLKNEGPKDLTDVCLELAAYILHLAGRGSLEECAAQAREVLENGQALQKFFDMVRAQGGEVDWEPQDAAIKEVFTAEEDGYVERMNAEIIGIAASVLGAGRLKKSDPIDYRAGIYLKAKCGDYVKQGDVLAVLYTSDAGKLAEARRRLKEAYQLGKEKPVLHPHIYEAVL